MTISVQVCGWWVKRHILYSSHTAERFIYFWILQISFAVKKKYFFLPKGENALMKHLCLFTSHYSVAASSKNLYPSFSSNSWLSWTFSSILEISGSCLGLFQYPLLHLHLKKRIFPLDLVSLFPWQETKGRHCLWKSNPFQSWEHKVRLRESIALQTWRCCACWRDGGCLGDSWAGAGGAGVKDKTAVVGSRIHSPAPCLHSVAFSGAAKQVPVGWIAVGVAQGAAGWWKGSREPAPAYGLEVWLP